MRRRRAINAPGPRFAGTHDDELLRFARSLNSYPDASQLLQALPAELHIMIPANTWAVVHSSQEQTVTGFTVNHNGHDISACPVQLTGHESYRAWIDELQAPLVLSPLDAETRFSDSVQFFRAHGNQSLCILPLNSGDRHLGAICAGRKSAHAFSNRDVSLLSLLADYAAQALDARQSFATAEVVRAQLENERTKLKLILDLNNSVVSNLELKKVIESISPNIRSVMQLDAVALILPAEDSRELQVYALDFPDNKGIIRSGVSISSDGLPGQVFRSGTPWVGDLSEARQAISGNKPAFHEGFQASCLLPLVRCDRVLGVLCAARLRKYAFTAQDVEFLLQISGQVAIAIDNALAYRQITELTNKLTQEKLYLEDEIRSELNFDEIVGNSPVLRRVLRQVEAVAPTDSTVLIHGETGSGKELIARAVHNLSRRSAHAFVKLNCAAIPTGLLESELFGHEKGAFTGAITQRIGRFELASQGTIFLDEVGEIPLDLQPKLLRVLQEREFERLGSSRTLRTDARLIAATNRDLKTMVEEQRFRSDLFYRLNVFPIHVPPLRERAEDIPFLIRHFAQHFARNMKKRLDTISTETMNALVRYPWPGNIRELQNVIERAVILSNGPALKVPLADLKPRVAENGSSHSIATLEEVERRHILSVLDQTNWVFSGPHGAASRLGMKRSTLQFRMRKLGISRPSRPSPPS